MRRRRRSSWRFRCSIASRWFPCCRSHRAFLAPQTLSRTRRHRLRSHPLQRLYSCSVFLGWIFGLFLDVALKAAVRDCVCAWNDHERFANLTTVIQILNLSTLFLSSRQSLRLFQTGHHCPTENQTTEYVQISSNFIWSQWTVYSTCAMDCSSDVNSSRGCSNFNCSFSDAMSDSSPATKQTRNYVISKREK